VKTMLCDQELEYDFSLKYGGRSPFEIGDSVSSGLRDGYGAIVHFVGSGSVVGIRGDLSPVEVTTVYVKIYPFIEMTGGENALEENVFDASFSLLAVVNEVKTWRPFHGRETSKARVLLIDRNGGECAVEIPVTPIVKQLDAASRYLVEIKFRRMAEDENFMCGNTPEETGAERPVNVAAVASAVSNSKQTTDS